MTDYRRIHSPEMQQPMHVMRSRPACYTAVDNGHACACCYTPEMQQDLLAHTPGCTLCISGQLAAAIYYREHGQ